MTSGQWKDITIVVLGALVIVVIWANSNLRSTERQTTVSSQITVPTAAPSPSAMPSPSLTPYVGRSVVRLQSSDPFNEVRAEQVRQLQKAVIEASKPAIDRRIENARAEIRVLQTNLQNLQSAELAANQNMLAQIQLQESLQRQRQTHLANRILGIERMLVSARREYPNQPELVAEAQKRVSELEATQRDLENQQEDILSTGENEFARLSDEANRQRLTARVTQDAVNSQIAFLQSEIIQLNEERTRSDDTVSALKERLKTVQDESARGQPPQVNGL